MTSPAPEGLPERATVPYPGAVVPVSHPGHTSAVATLFGIRPPDPTSARVLELGCGDATNLLEIAEDLPGAELLGVDLDAGAIERGRAAAAGRGLENLNLQAGDLMKHDLGGARFDYIIAHGLFSWVPDPVKERIFAICAKHLAPAGIAFVSYNALPGWAYHRAVVDLVGILNPQPPRDGDAVERETFAALERVQESVTRLDYPHLPLLREEIRQIRSKPAAAVFHDEHGDTNDPCYVLQFAEWAAEHGLVHVSDALLTVDVPSALPPSLASLLSPSPEHRLRNEQVLDFVLNRRFRMSLLARADASPRPSIDRSAVTRLRVHSTLQPVGSAAGKRAKERRFDAPDGKGIRVADRDLRVALDRLAQHPGRYVPYPELRGAVVAGLGGEAPEDLDARLGELILECAARGFLSLSTVDRKPRPLSGGIRTGAV